MPDKSAEKLQKFTLQYRVHALSMAANVLGARSAEELTTSAQTIFEYLACIGRFEHADRETPFPVGIEEAHGAEPIEAAPSLADIVRGSPGEEQAHEYEVASISKDGIVLRRKAH